MDILRSTLAICSWPELLHACCWTRCSKQGASAGRTSSPAGVLTVNPPSTGLTPIDLAINNRHVKLVRRLEQRAFFSGWLLMKVPKYMGLGSEWKSRWCVIMPRYPNVSLCTCCTLWVPLGLSSRLSASWECRQLMGCMQQWACCLYQERSTARLWMQLQTCSQV